jgi:pimeloyl-ACP methyl ester carboxylesterase
VPRLRRVGRPPVETRASPRSSRATSPSTTSIAAGRGDSGDTLPYAIDREIEDIEAVIDAAGGQAYLYGTSSGAALAFEAARALPGKVTKLALWEPPYIDDPAARPPSDTVETYERLVAEGRRSDAVEYFTAKVVGLPPEFVAFAKTQPFWAAQEKIAHTLAYDGRIMGDYSIPVEKAKDVTQPTIVVAGESSFPFFLQTVAVLATRSPTASRRRCRARSTTSRPR